MMSPEGEPQADDIKESRGLWLASLTRVREPGRPAEGRSPAILWRGAVPS